MYRSLDDLSVLIVEDNAFIRKLMRSMLRQIPVGEVQEYEDGREGLKLLNTRHFDIVLLDWVMPRLSGGQFLEVLIRQRKKSRTQVPPVLVVTANASRQVVLEAAQLGADGVIAKPFSVSVLRDRIFAVINRDAIKAAKLADIEDQRQAEDPGPLLDDEAFFI